MDLQQYLKKEFQGLTLFEDSFDGREFSIHLELENKLYQLKDDSDEINTDYFNNVYNKATEIFEGIFKENDEIYLVAHIRSELSLMRNKKTNIFKRYLKNQKDIYKLRYKQVNLYSEEQIGQYSVLLSNKNKLIYKSLIKAICNQDFKGLQPRLNDNKYTYYPKIFFINKSKNVILNIYDHRGCFVLFKNVNDLNSFKEKYKEALTD